MKVLTLITLIILAAATDRVVIPDQIKKIIDEMPEFKESLIAKKLLTREMELERILEINQVEDESDSIKDSIQFIKVTQSTYNSSNTNYTQPNITYNYTSTNYTQPNSSNIYYNQTNSTNYTNSTQPNNYYYNTSYPTSNGVNNYVTQDNQTSQSQTCQVGYYLATNYTCLPCQDNCAICSSQYACMGCYYGYTLFTNGCYLDQNSTSNSSVINDNTTNTNSTTQQDNSTTIFNTSDNTYYNITSDNTYNTTNNTYYNTTDNTYSNSTTDNTYYNSTTDDSSQYNQTYNNYTNNSRIRDRFNQSRVHLKLRNNFNRFDNNNFTQIISYYNQSNHSQNTVVLFNSSAVVQKQSLNEYYLYQNNTLVVLNQEFDPYGNVVYRSIDYDFTIVVSKQQGSNNQKQNQEIYGTIVYGYGDFSATYNNQKYESGYGSYNNYYNQKSANGQVTYNQDYRSGSAQFNNRSNGQSSSYQSDSFYNGTIDKSNSSSSNSYSNSNYNYSGYINFDQNYSKSQSSYSNNEQSYSSSDDYLKVNGIGHDNYNTQVSSSSENRDSYSSNFYGDKSQYSSSSSKSNYNSSQDNIIYAQNYTLVNESQIGYNLAYSSNNEQNDWRNYSNSDYSNGYKKQDSTYIHNYTDSYNVTDVNEYKSNSHYQSLQYNGGDENSNGYNNFASGQAHSVQITNDDITTTNVNATINQLNQSNYNGQPQFEGASSTKDINLQVIDNQQYFTQLRGSKKLATGSWKEVNQKEFVSSNASIVQEARQAVSNKFNPEQEGFQFDSISSIQEQIVAGINYNIKLKYLNADSQSIIYEVVLYTIPWANKPNQIVSCSRFDQSEI